ncbi:MAG: hypothetical protein K6G64_01010 [Eubacterium sp.]|nr:hypothetical protein [Eubacterium sp.]
MLKGEWKTIATNVMLGLTMILTLYVIVVLEPGYYHADCTDTIMWAGASYDAGTFINPDFSYAALMPLAGNIIMWPLIAIFGLGMKAQIIGMVIFFVMFVAAIFGFCRRSYFSMKETAVAISLILLLVSSSEKLREIFWGHIIYYSFGPLLTLAVLAVVFRLRKEVKKNLADKGVEKKTIAYGILLMVLTFIAGVNGVQIAAISVIPVLGAIAAYLFFEVKQPLLSKKNYSYLIVGGVVGIGTVLGIVSIKHFTGNVVASYANAYSIFGKMEDWINNFFSIPNNVFTLLGVQLEDHTELFSLTGIFVMLRIVTAIILLGTPIAMLFRYQKIKKPEWKIVLLTHHLVAAVILFGWIFGRLNAANWRLSPLIVTAALCCMIQVKEFRQKKMTGRLAALILIPMFCFMALTVRQCLTIPEQSNATKELKGVIQYLEENEYSYGYATFWNANVITLFSDSEVKTRCVKYTAEGIQPDYYQTNRKWYGKDGEKGKCFVLMTQSEFAQLELGNMNQYTAEKDFGNFKILTYEENIFNGENENAVY